jgi:predicted enzyme related to lactoylglutathione lyase
MATAQAAGTIVGMDIFGPSTSNPQRLIAFYRDVLGMIPTAVDPNGGGAEFELADGATFGVYQPPQPKDGGGYAALFAVDDINTAVARMRERGATLSDPMETPVCFISLGQDPDGNTFGVHQRK